VREERPDHGGIVQRGDQPQPTPAMRARQNIKRERPVHQRCGVGSWGGRCLSLGDYVTGMGATSGVTAAGGW
jgi:hypothetical protein